MQVSIEEFCAQASCCSLLTSRCLLWHLRLVPPRFEHLPSCRAPDAAVGRPLRLSYHACTSAAAVEPFTTG